MAQYHMFLRLCFIYVFLLNGIESDSEKKKTEEKERKSEWESQSEDREIKLSTLRWWMKHPRWALRAEHVFHVFGIFLLSFHTDSLTKASGKQPGFASLLISEQSKVMEQAGIRETEK